MRIVLATSNPGKLRELEALLTPLDVELLPQSQFTRECANESGLSFVENAIFKARHAARHAALPAIADDSGLEVDALDGGPGIHSARYAGAHASDADNLARLLEAMAHVADERRTARYRCALVYLRSASDPAPLVCQAAWEGRLLRSPRGKGGFGYDPVFEVPGLGRTAAELDPAVKNRLSHRGRALADLARLIAPVIARQRGASC